MWLVLQSSYFHDQSLQEARGTGWFGKFLDQNNIWQCFKLIAIKKKVTTESMAKDSEACPPDVCLQWDGRKIGFSCVLPMRAAGLFQLRKADVELTKT